MGSFDKWRSFQEGSPVIGNRGYISPFWEKITGAGVAGYGYATTRGGQGSQSPQSQSSQSQPSGQDYQSRQGQRTLHHHKDRSHKKQQYGRKPYHGQVKQHYQWHWTKITTNPNNVYVPPRTWVERTPPPPGPQGGRKTKERHWPHLERQATTGRTIQRLIPLPRRRNTFTYFGHGRWRRRYFDQRDYY